jgi:K+-transporting ATPase KdpF subunit
VEFHGERNGHRLYRRTRGGLAPVLGFRCRLRKTGRKIMTPFYVLGAFISAGLLVYLVIALLKAEDL